MHYNFKVLTRKLLLKVVTKVEILNYFWSCATARFGILISFCLHLLCKLRLKCYTLTPKSWLGSYRSKCSQVRSDIHSSLIPSNLWLLLYIHDLVLIISIVFCVYCSNLPIVPFCVLFCPVHCSLHITWSYWNAALCHSTLLRVSYSCHEISKSTSLDCNKICSDGVK